MPPRGRGGKFSKPTRGGGKHFSRDLQPLDKDGNALGMWRDPAEKKDETSSEEEEESSEEESSEDDDAPSSSAAATGELSREQRKEIARKKKQDAIAKKNKKVAAPGDMPTESEESSEEDEGDLPANPNHTSKARNQARAVTGASGESPLPKRGEKENLSRREREAIAAQQAKERYQKLHAEGKTDEAKADLARLKLIKQQREEATARKQAEKEEREERERENKERHDKEDKKRAEAMGAPTTTKKASVKSREAVKGKK